MPSPRINQQLRRKGRFTPRDLPGLLWQLETDGGLYQDVALSVPAVSENDPLGAWGDQSGFSRHPFQATGASKPLLKTSVGNTLNGYPTVMFDGVDDFLVTPSSLYPYSQPFTVYMVMRNVSWVNTSVILAGSLDGVATRITQQSSTSSHGVGLSFGNNAPNSYDLADGDWGIVTTVVNGANSRVSVNGNPAVVGDAGANNPTGLSIGARASGTSPANVQIAAVILCAGEHNGGVQGQVRSYLKQKYALGTHPKTYFVDATGGSDSNDGLSTGAAWQTLAKVSATHFMPGDVILFKRGETWNETLTPLSNGSETQPIGFGAYGSGALPLFEESSTRLYGINATQRTYLIIEDIKVHAPTNSGILFSGPGVHTVSRCVLDASGDQNVQHLGSVSGGMPTMTYNDCTFSNAVDDGISIHDGIITVNRCTFTGNTQGINTSTTASVLTVNDSVFSGNVTDNVLTDVNCVTTFNRCWFASTTSGSNNINLTGVLNYCVIDLTAATVQAKAIVQTTTTATLRNCTIYGGPNTYGSFSVGNGKVINLVNCLVYKVWRCGSITGTGQINADHCLFNTVTIKTLTTNTNEVTAAPQLVSPTTSNFHLLSGSPARNAGVAIAGLAQDYDGVAVPQESVPAIGAYEYV